MEAKVRIGERSMSIHSKPVATFGEILAPTKTSALTSQQGLQAVQRRPMDASGIVEWLS
jgi:hypothetical protein